MTFTQAQVYSDMISHHTLLLDGILQQMYDKNDSAVIVRSLFNTVELQWLEH